MVFFVVGVCNDFYPRPPRGGRLRRCTESGCLNQISIHALREEGDLQRTNCTRSTSDFYPRPPRGGRPRCQRIHDRRQCISIHALREEGDDSILLAKSAETYFYPRPPRGGRRWILLRLRCSRISIHALREEGDRFPKCQAVHVGVFLSTPSARRATNEVERRRAECADFYPRPPRGGRRTFLLAPMGRSLFLSTPSARRATSTARRAPWDGYFISIHALREEGDLADEKTRQLLDKFLSTPSARRATSWDFPELCGYHYFYPRPPRGGRRRV